MIVADIFTKDGNRYINCVLFRSRRAGERAIQNREEVEQILMGKEVMVHFQNKAISASTGANNISFYEIKEITEEEF